MKIYTTGYTGKRVEDLPDLLDRLDAVLADIRFSPHSRSLEWTYNYLTLLLKKRYRHVSALGNRAFREGKITIHNLELGIKILESRNENVVLLCACKDLHRCHRLIVAEELRKRGFAVEEIENW